MNFYSFFLAIIFIIYLYDRLNKGPYITQGGVRWEVPISNHQFEKSTLNVKQGDIIEFINKDQIRHTIKTNNLDIKNSPILFQNDTWIYQCQNANDVKFESSLYSNMNTITIIVKGEKNVKSVKKELKTNITGISNVIKKKLKKNKNSLIEKIRNILK
jgi:plastocyanin